MCKNKFCVKGRIKKTLKWLNVRHMQGKSLGKKLRELSKQEGAHCTAPPMLDYEVLHSIILSLPQEFPHGKAKNGKSWDKNGRFFGSFSFTWRFVCRWIFKKQVYKNEKHKHFKTQFTIILMSF